MEQPYLKLKLVRDGAKVPTKRVEDGFFDLYGVFEEDPFYIYPGELKLVPLGFSTEFPPNWAFRIYERSSAGSKGISARCGVIDSGYRGEYFAAVNNTTNSLIVITNKAPDEIKEKHKEQIKGYEEKMIVYPSSKAIVQGGLIYSPHIDIEVTEELNMVSERRDGTLGSTNK